MGERGRQCSLATAPWISTTKLQETKDELEKKMASTRWKNEETSGRGELITRRDGVKRREVTLAFARAPLSPACMRGANFSGRGETKDSVISPNAGDRGGTVAWPGSVGCMQPINPRLQPIGPDWAKIGEPNAPQIYTHSTLHLPMCCCFLLSPPLQPPCVPPRHGPLHCRGAPHSAVDPRTLDTTRCRSPNS
jgi:hypothetical protein